MSKEKIVIGESPDILLEKVEKTNSVSELKKLVMKNIEYTKVIYEQNKKIKRKLTIMLFAGYLKLIIIIAPLIVALIYLPPFLSDLWGKYGDLLSSGQGLSSITDFGEIMGLFGGADSSVKIDSDQLQKIINNPEQLKQLLNKIK